MAGCGSDKKANSSEYKGILSSFQNQKDSDKKQENDAGSKDEADSEDSADSEDNADPEDEADSEDDNDLEDNTDLEDETGAEDEAGTEVATPSIPDYPKMHITFDGADLAVPATVSSWEAAGLTVSYSGDPEKGCAGRAWDTKYNSFFIELRVAVIGGPFGDAPCIVAAELPVFSMVKRDLYATPEIPEIKVLGGELTIGESYDLSSKGVLFGESYSIYSYGTYDEKSAELMMKWTDGIGWERTNEMDPWNAWYTEYRYEENGTSVFLVTLDKGDYERALDIDALAGFRIAFDRTWIY